MGKAIETNLPCPNPECGSSDAYTIYQSDDGKGHNAYCYSCTKWFSDPYRDHDQNSTSSVESNIRTSLVKENKPLGTSRATQSKDEYSVGSKEECLAHSIHSLKHRGITQATCEKYGVRTGVDTRNGVAPIYSLFPCHRNGDLVGFKQKFYDGRTQSYTSIGDCKNLDLFGANVIPQKGKKLFITEGELDCLALYQALKQNSNISWEPAVVSLPTGAGNAAKSIALNMELIDGFDEIILCFDRDAAGNEASTKVCKILAGKVYVAQFPLKDANEMLLAGRENDLKWAVLTNARKYQPDGIVNGADCWERYKSTNESECYPYPQTMPGLNEKLYGARPGSLIAVTSGTGMGKSQFLRELKYHFLQTTTLKMADIALEEDVGDTIGGMLSLHLNKRITLPDVNVSEAEEQRAFEEVYGTGRFTLYDYFGGMDDESLFSKLRYFAATGHKLFFLDHLSIIVSEYAADGGERERIDTIMTKLAKFVKETGVIIFLVIHLKKPEGTRKSFEEGAVPSLDDLRGSGTLKQLIWDGIGLSRNQQHSDPFCRNITELTVLKCRLTGRTGKAGYLHFNDHTGRMVAVEPPPNYYPPKKSKFG